MKRKKRQDSPVLTKIVCSKCGAVDYVSFVPAGDRPYFCSRCLEEMHNARKRGKVEEIPSKNGTVYRFLCDSCERIVKQLQPPLNRDGMLYCRACAEKIARIEQAEQRKKAKIRVVKNIPDSDKK